MFDKLEKYKEQDHFFLTVNDRVADKCNAPSKSGGVYIVYALKNGEIELAYIGRSGRVDKNGKMIIRNAGLGGLLDRIVNGHHFGVKSGESPWIYKLRKEKIEALDIYWYVTHGATYVDNPVIVKRTIMERYFNLYGRLPRWNN